MSNEVTEIFDGTSYCTLATTCENGTPWNVPIRFSYDDEYLYFRSPPSTTHGLNIARNNRVSIVIVDTTQGTKGAIYLNSGAQKLNGSDEQIAIENFKKRFNNPPDQWPVTEYYRVEIGEVDQTRSIAKMYYFQNRGQQ